MYFVKKLILISTVSVTVFASETDIKAAVEAITNSIFDRVDKPMPKIERPLYLKKLIGDFQQEIAELEQRTDIVDRLKSEHIRILNKAISLIIELLPTIEQYAQKELDLRYRHHLAAKTSNATILLKEGLPVDQIDFILAEANNLPAYLERLNIRDMYPQDFIYAQKLPGQDVLSLQSRLDEISIKRTGPDKIDNFIELEHLLEEQITKLPEIIDDQLREALSKKINFILELLRALKDDLIRRETTKVEMQKRRLESERRKREQGDAAAAPQEEVSQEPEIIPIPDNTLKRSSLDQFIDSLNLDNRITDPYIYKQSGYIFIHPVCKNETNQYKEIDRKKLAERDTFELPYMLVLKLNKGTPEEVEQKKEIISENYKIHLTVKPEYVLWTIKFILDKFNNDNFCDYNIDKFKVEINLEEFQIGDRIFPTIVIYATGPESAQDVYDKLKWLNKLPDISPGYFMRHNYGGPVVWWAGGDADVKPGGGFYIDFIKDFLAEDPEHPGSYPHFKFQQPLRN
ncbi:hypothetical protein A3F66_04880 [candidate division TM6 bacterium RIFCSPHIGHO2_12_FULL_32_22]|nr:MAG: hypothetical protein A3F66_04880 [candidate division TM6 bacterium RIFCSPHIGHO2_12_FULL_32_22]